MRLPIVLVLACAVTYAAAGWKFRGHGENFRAPLPACVASDRFYSHGHIDLPVVLASGDEEWNQAFRRALDFWSRVIDMTWTESKDVCAASVHDAPIGFLNGRHIPTPQTGMIIALSQGTQWTDFTGSIVVDTRFIGDAQAKFVVAVHEFGHLLDLAHNEDDNESAMRPSVDDTVVGLVLDKHDLEVLSKRHELTRYATGLVRIVVE